MVEFLKEAAHVVPSKRQLDWFEMERYAFVHYGVNTYTDREWGEGTEDEKIFNPTALDCDQWVEAVKSAGLKGLILTAKHHDGFCLWPSKYTEHSVKNSPYKGDVVREAAEACKRGGIKFGFYLSPWDRNSKYYGTPEYNDYFCNQLTELLTGYGDIFCVWFDNACGEGENGKKQEYDFPRYFELIRKYQPNAVIFNDFGPDTRWCGNEAGEARHAEWAVVPSELCFYSEVQTGAGRTGRFLACEHAGIRPDVVTLAKGLGGGLPVGACLCAERLGGVMGPGTHGSTFGGNPVVCAAGWYMLSRLADPDFLAQVARKGEVFRRRLSAMPHVAEVRGLGMMLGVKLDKGSSREAAEKCLENGLLILTAKTLLRLLPPLNISEEEMDRGLSILESTLAAL